MKIGNIEVDIALKNVQHLLESDKDLSPALKAALDVLMLLVGILINQKMLNSKNSSKPPSADPNRDKVSKKGNSKRKPGAQKGHKGVTLSQVPDPDDVTDLTIDRRALPKGSTYQQVGYEVRQVIDIDIRRLVMEYRAEVLEDEQGNRFVAEFPSRVKRPVQYGNSIKANAVYLSQFQLIPYDRVRDHFADQMDIPISVGSIFKFNQEAFNGLAQFELWAKKTLAQGEYLHADETGVNIDGKRHWLHVACTLAVTWLSAHAKRGTVAMDEIGILPAFGGVLCHDHWQPYYQYSCQHSLCHAHHIRELERAWEQDGQQWAKQMQSLLIEMNCAVDNNGGCLSNDDSDTWRLKYRALLDQADIECPPPDTAKPTGKRGRIKRSKARNLLERLRDFETDVLRFMDVAFVPFTNNQGENDLRMTKVQQKISGCFRSMEGANIFCRVRSYISTCRKQGLTATQALTLLFEGEMPDFMQSG